MASIQTGSVLDRSVLKEGQIFLVTDHGGDIKALNMEGHGLYFRDTRHLSLFEMDISGTRLVLLSAAGELNFMSNLQLANDTLIGQRGEIAADARTISVHRNRFLYDGLHERVALVNYNQHTIHLTVRVTFGSDFRDMFEVRGYFNDEGDGRGEMLPIELQPSGAQLSYRGRDGVERQTRVLFDPKPDTIEIVNERLREVVATDRPAASETWSDPRVEGRVFPPVAAAVFEIDLPPMGARQITIAIMPGASEERPLPETTPNALDTAFVGIRDSYDSWRAESTEFTSDHETFDQLLNRALQDLRLLTDTVDGDLVTTAGIPWFAVPFGRDSLITAMQTLPLRPAIAAGTLRFLARQQGTRIDDFRDEEPGKILHEVRYGELSRLGRVPHTRYYGSADSTPLFLITLGEYVRWTGDLALVRELLPHAEAALRWMAEYGDADGDGFLEYSTRSSEGIRNQGWKDSPDSTSHRNGVWAEPPIALAEVQGYAYGAYRAMAEVYTLLEQPEAARLQLVAADRVREAFLTRLAMEDEAGPFWAMGLDRDKRRIETVTTNPGHALWTGLLRGEHARLTVARLMRDDMLAGWGLRTLSSHARSFNPMSYHNGSIWPHDNALVALGMKRAGADEAACEVAWQIFETGLRMPANRLPELYCGFARDRRYRSQPAQYPVSCSPQAWAAGSAFMLVQALLGLEAEALGSSVRLRPLLPPWLSRVSVRKLRVGSGSVDFDVVREGHRVLVDVLEDGGLEIEVHEPS